jgi:hypothetical protein
MNSPMEGADYLLEVGRSWSSCVFTPIYLLDGLKKDSLYLPCHGCQVPWLVLTIASQFSSITRPGRRLNLWDLINIKTLWLDPMITSALKWRSKRFSARPTYSSEMTARKRTLKRHHPNPRFEAYCRRWKENQRRSLIKRSDKEPREIQSAQRRWKANQRRSY